MLLKGLTKVRGKLMSFMSDPVFGRRNRSRSVNNLSLRLRAGSGIWLSES